MVIMALSLALTRFIVLISPESAVHLNFGVPAFAKRAAWSCRVEIRLGRITSLLDSLLKMQKLFRKATMRIG